MWDGKTALKQMHTAALLIKCTGGTAGTHEGNSGPLPLETPVLLPPPPPPRVSEHSEAAWVLAVSQKSGGEGSASGESHFCLHQPQLATNKQVWGPGSAAVLLCFPPSVSGPANEPIRFLPHNRPGADGPTGPLGAASAHWHGCGLGHYLAGAKPIRCPITADNAGAGVSLPTEASLFLSSELGTDVPGA